MASDSASKEFFDYFQSIASAAFGDMLHDDERVSSRVLNANMKFFVFFSLE